MTSLAAKYDYLEKLTRKICVSHCKEPKKRPYVPYKASSANDAGPPKKKKKNKQRSTQSYESPSQRKTAQSASADNRNNPEVTASKELNAVDLLRRRLHQKIEESRGQGAPKDPFSEDVIKKREKRKQERERRKKKRKALQMKKIADDVTSEAGEGEKEIKSEPDNAKSSETPEKEQSFIVFNKMEVKDDYVDKGTKLNEKKKKRKIKGTLTPLTGKNYKQLLTRIEARKTHLEQLKEKDEGRAKKEEEKMRWTNVLYKAEGMKIKDNEELLHASLKKKEKRKAQLKKKWEKRSEHVVETMQKKQDKRKRNIKRRADAKIEKRKQRARKKGRVLPGDLKKAAV